MTKALDLMTLARHLLDGSTPFALMRYIFRVQQAEWRRLDYEAAAKALSLDRRTIGRTVTALADKKLLLLRGSELKISDELIKQKTG